MKTLPPDAVDVFPVDSYTLIVTFSNGEKRRFDLTPLLQRKCYASLQNPSLRSSVYVENGCVTWPGEMDIDPDWLYEDSVAVSNA